MELHYSSFVFSSRDALLEYLQRVGMNAGYAIVIKRSDKKRGTVELGCDLNSHYRKRIEKEDGRRLRKTGSRLQGSSCNVHGRCGVDTFWRLKRVADKIEHSREPAQDLSGHPYCLRLDCAATKQVNSMASAGIAPKHISDEKTHQHC
ncbi:hypothetical protein PsorP6_005859 [Peronosclerospora sorghi]|uniref:Uncharacterized protein n=1 Tax=Peronosclerospora sorghi TaxID=230839 RepID=A0ACC0W4T0_9STRA|nr:hypothetical protein PsorP6_005859 [Peronosclerospora sorghi]